MNNKGFMLSTSIFGIMLMSAAIIFAFYSPIVDAFTSFKRSEERLLESIQLRNAYERSKGLNDGVADMNYDDLNIQVLVNRDGDVVFKRGEKVLLSLSEEE